MYIVHTDSEPSERLTTYSGASSTYYTLIQNPVKGSQHPQGPLVPITHWFRTQWKVHNILRPTDLNRQLFTTIQEYIQILFKTFVQLFKAHRNCGEMKQQWYNNKKEEYTNTNCLSINKNWWSVQKKKDYNLEVFTT